MPMHRTVTLASNNNYFVSLLFRLWLWKISMEDMWKEMTSSLRKLLTMLYLRNTWWVNTTRGECVVRHPHSFNKNCQDLNSNTRWLQEQQLLREFGWYRQEFFIIIRFICSLLVLWTLQDVEWSAVDTTAIWWIAIMTFAHSMYGIQLSLVIYNSAIVHWSLWVTWSFLIVYLNPKTQSSDISCCIKVEGSRKFQIRLTLLLLVLVWNWRNQY